MKFPKFLPDGGTIGFVAPSFGCATSPYQETFEHAQKRFTELGYRLDLGPNCYESSGVGISNTPEKCAQELMEYYVKSDNDCLISCGGGELMCEILPYMDFDRLAKADPKWYMGYSDNTNMTYLLATLADTASIYGPCAGAFGMELWHPAISDAFHLLTGRTQTVSGYPLWEKEALKDETITPIPQNEEEASYASMLSKKDSLIDWNKTAQQVHNQVRGLSPWPVANTMYHGKQLKIHQTLVSPEKRGNPGDVIEKNNKFFVCCGDGAVELVTVQYEGGKRMSAKDFFRGRPLKESENLLIQ